MPDCPCATPHSEPGSHSLSVARDVPPKSTVFYRDPLPTLPSPGRLWTGQCATYCTLIAASTSDAAPASALGPCRPSLRHPCAAPPTLCPLFPPPFPRADPRDPHGPLRGAPPAPGRLRAREHAVPAAGRRAGPRLLHRHGGGGRRRRNRRGAARARLAAVGRARGGVPPARAEQPEPRARVRPRQQAAHAPPHLPGAIAGGKAQRGRSPLPAAAAAARVRLRRLELRSALATLLKNELPFFSLLIA